MKIEDCKVGMKVKYLKSDSAFFDEGEVLTIKSVDYNDNLVIFEESGSVFTSHKNIEPANKFNVGDKVFYTTYRDNYKAEVLLVGNDDYGTDYVIKILSDWHDKKNIITVTKKEIKPLKSKSNLEVGDTFRALDSTFEVESVGYDEVLKETCYFASSNYSKKQYYLVFESQIEEIIYK